MGEIFTKKIADGEKQIFVGDFLQITKKKKLFSREVEISYYAKSEEIFSQKNGKIVIKIQLWFH